jgi:hypothetical protein
MPRTVTARHARDRELLRGSLVTIRRRCGKPTATARTTTRTRPGAVLLQGRAHP